MGRSTLLMPVIEAWEKPEFSLVVFTKLEPVRSELGNILY